ncbi:MAG: hypothetical protein JY451_00645 [Erythrobacter sp.]|nr:MAG: hypothetical protein JY451_00645 [Erythrobacter sp.]
MANICVAQPPAPKGEQLMVIDMIDQGAEYAGKGHEMIDKVAQGTKAGGMLAAGQAFRRFDWLAFEPIKNGSGNLRGMVVNKRMRTIFQFTKSIDKHSSKLAAAGALIEVAKEMDRIQKVMNSNIADSEKYSRALLLGSAAILRSVTSVVPGAVELASTSARGYAMLFSEISGSKAGYKLADQLDGFSKEITAIHKKQWDGETWYNVIEAALD